MKDASKEDKPLKIKDTLKVPLYITSKRGQPLYKGLGPKVCPLFGGFTVIATINQSLPEVIQMCVM